MIKIKEFWAAKSKKQKAFIIGGTIVIFTAAGVVAYKLGIGKKAIEEAVQTVEGLEPVEVVETTIG